MSENTGVTVLDFSNVDLCGALKMIENRRYFYHGDIYHLRTFINGWLSGRNSRDDWRFYYKIQEHITESLNEKSSPAFGWCQMLVKHYGDERATRGFFELLLNYCGESPL